MVSQSRQAERTTSRRHGKTLFIDVSEDGPSNRRVHKELSEDEVDKIAKAYHALAGRKGRWELRGPIGVKDQ